MNNFIVKYEGDLDGFIHEYMQIETMIVTRFHAMILSLLADQNMYPFAYEPKMSNVLKDLQYTGEYSDIRAIENVDLIIKSLETKKYSLNHSSVRESAEKQFLKLEQFITL